MWKGLNSESTCKKVIIKSIYDISFQTETWKSCKSKSKLCQSVSHCWGKTHRERQSRSPPGSCWGTTPRCQRPGWTRSCGPDVSESSSSTGRSEAALRRCHAWRAPGAPAFLPAGQRTRSRCTHSEKSIILSLLQRGGAECRSLGRDLWMWRVQQSVGATFKMFLYLNWGSFLTIVATNTGKERNKNLCNAT